MPATTPPAQPDPTSVRPHGQPLGGPAPAPQQQAWQPVQGAPQGLPWNPGQVPPPRPGMPQGQPWQQGQGPQQPQPPAGGRPGMPPHAARPGMPVPPPKGHPAAGPKPFDGIPATTVVRPDGTVVEKRALARSTVRQWRLGGWAMLAGSVLFGLVLSVAVMTGVRPNLAVAIGLPFFTVALMAPGTWYLLAKAKVMDRQLAHPDQDIWTHPDDDPRYQTRSWKSLRFLGKLNDLIG